MRRRDFICGAGAAAASLAVRPRALAAKEAPDYMRIMNERMVEGDYLPCYEEPEITEPVMLCDGKGFLNPDAVGWSRRPLHKCNLSGNWPRKKKWNTWEIISKRFSISFLVADIDYAGLAVSQFIDYETKKHAESLVVTPLGAGVDLPELIEEDMSFSSPLYDLSMLYRGEEIRVDFRCMTAQGKDVKADLAIRYPEDHETLNVVIPWTKERFNFTSKQNTLPAEGFVSVGGERYDVRPEECHAVADFGRGMWPYRTWWNWGVCSGKQGDDLIGFNMGSKWTTGTGANENGVCYNGRLYKVMEDVRWDYDAREPMKPWRIRTEHSDMVDITLTPVHKTKVRLNMGFLSLQVAQAPGRWSGTFRIDGKRVEFEDLAGWAEECGFRW